MARYKVTLAKRWRRNGKLHRSGQTVNDVTEDELKRLKADGAVASHEEVAKPQTPPSPPDPNTLSPEAIADMNARDAAAAISGLATVEAVQEVAEIESAKDKPRETVIKAIEARIDELAPAE